MKLLEVSSNGDRFRLALHKDDVDKKNVVMMDIWDGISSGFAIKNPKQMKAILKWLNEASKHIS